MANQPQNQSNQNVSSGFDPNAVSFGGNTGQQRTFGNIGQSNSANSSGNIFGSNSNNNAQPNFLANGQAGNSSNINSGNIFGQQQPSNSSNNNIFNPSAATQGNTMFSQQNNNGGMFGQNNTGGNTMFGNSGTNSSGNNFLQGLGANQPGIPPPPSGNSGLMAMRKWSSLKQISLSTLYNIYKRNEYCHQITFNPTK